MSPRRVIVKNPARTAAPENRTNGGFGNEKDLGVKPSLFFMPVLMIATYNEDGTVDVMNMA